MRERGDAEQESPIQQGQQEVVLNARAVNFVMCPSRDVLKPPFNVCMFAGSYGGHRSTTHVSLCCWVYVSVRLMMDYHSSILRNAGETEKSEVHFASDVSALKPLSAVTCVAGPPPLSCPTRSDPDDAARQCSSGTLGQNPNSRCH